MGASRRQARKSATRDALHTAALSLFQFRGYDNVTMEDIAAAGGVSRRTLFRYFGSKRDFIFFNEAAASERLRHLVHEHAAAYSGWNLARQAVLSFANELDASPELPVQLRIIAGTDGLRGEGLLALQRWATVLAGGLAQSEGFDTPEVRHRVVAATAFVPLNLALRSLVMHDGTFSPVATKTAEALAELNGLCGAVADAQRERDAVT